LASGLLIIKLLGLLVLANGAPVLARKLLGSRWDTPVDGNIKLPDQHPIFGRSKTIRGFVSAILATAIIAPVLGFSWEQGALIGLMTMVGDLISSFIKRRLKMPPSSRAVGLDQIPETLLPLLVIKTPLGLSWFDVLTIVLVFLVLEVTLSKWLFRMNIRDRPY
jgi:hypothetical protein